MLQQFTRAFTHTMEADNAFIELQNCKMGEHSPDEYIAEFNELSRKAHWDHDNRGTVELFKQGLPVNIHRRILGRDTIPQTMPQWQEQLGTGGAVGAAGVVPNAAGSKPHPPLP
jgi:hypothetical protein